MSMKAARKINHEDGRTLRTKRSREAISNALFGLITEGQPNPTAAAIAARAGVSQRLVFHHYQDLESIYNEIIERQFAKLYPLLELDLSPDEPFDRRLAAFLEHRTHLLELVVPMRKAALLRSQSHTTVQEALQIIRRFKREQVSIVFRPEISRFSNPESRHREMAAQAAASWNTWETFRHHQELSIEESRSVMSAMLRSILEC